MHQMKYGEAKIRFGVDVVKKAMETYPIFDPNFHFESQMDKLLRIQKMLYASKRKPFVKKSKNK